MRDHEAAIARTGAHIATIGTGDLDYARDFRDQEGLGFPVLVDADLTTYRIVGTRKAGVGDIVRPSQIAAGLRAVASGHRQRRSGPAPMILGATHIIRPDGSVSFAWVNDDFADNAPPDEVVAALEAGH